MKKSVVITQISVEYLPLLFKVLLVWYLIGIFLEALFKGFVSNYINLDLFLWIVIITGLFVWIIRKKA